MRRNAFKSEASFTLIADSIHAVLKTTADRTSVNTLPDSFRFVVKTIAK